MLRRVARLRPWTPLLPRPTPAAAPGLHRCCCPRRAYSATKASDPLRILFCGSDEFSNFSLLALHKEHCVNPGLIESIDVVVRPGKPIGRGMKQIAVPPTKPLAEELGLPLHERDTFTGWDMPAATNLIVAVSFGLFVPPRLLHAAKYGGLNVHPSLLPNYHGPAPLQHLLLDGIQTTGVSLQTLDDKAFDKGVVLAREVLLWDGLKRMPRGVTLPQLRDKAGAAGAALLVDGLRRGLHVPPLTPDPSSVRGSGPAGQKNDDVKYMPAQPRHAPKITAHDRQIGSGINAMENPRSLALRQRVIGPLWFRARGEDPFSQCDRIIIKHLEEVPGSAVRRRDEDPSLGPWEHRRIFRMYQKAPRARSGRGAEKFQERLRTQEVWWEGEQKEDRYGERPDETEFLVLNYLHYWTREGDDAIYISKHNPPDEQRQTLARIDLLQVAGQPAARPAAAVARLYSSTSGLPMLTWRRFPNLARIVDFDLHLWRHAEALSSMQEMMVKNAKHVPPEVWIDTALDLFQSFNNTLAVIADVWTLDTRPPEHRDDPLFRWNVAPPSWVPRAQRAGYDSAAAAADRPIYSGVISKYIVRDHRGARRDVPRHREKAESEDVAWLHAPSKNDYNKPQEGDHKRAWVDLVN